MDPVRQSLYGLLDRATPAGVYFQVAPATATTPFVVFQKQSGLPLWAMDPTPAFENEVWLVKAVDRATSAGAAEDLAALLDQAVTDATLDIPGTATAFLRRQSDVAYAEQDGGETYHHVGALYRLVTTPT